MSMQWIQVEVERLIEPLARAAGSVHERRMLLLQLGLDVDEAKALAGAAAISDGLKGAIAALRALRTAFADGAPKGFGAWRDALEPLVEEIKTIYGGGSDVVDAVDGLATVPPPAEVLTALGNLILYRWLATYHPVAYGVLLLLGVIHSREARVPIQFDGRQLRALLRDPGAAIVDYYRKGTPNIQGTRALTYDQRPSVVAARIAKLLQGAGLDARVAAAKSGGDAAPAWARRTSHIASGRWQQTIPLTDEGAALQAELGVLFALLGPPEAPPSYPPIEGLALGVLGQVATSVPLGAWELRTAVTGSATVLTLDDKGLKFAGPGQAGASLTLVLPSQRTVTKGQPMFRIGAEEGTRLELWGASFGAAVTTQPDLTISAGVEDLRLVIAPGDGDGFLAQALAAAKIEAEFDLGLVWSQRKGLAFTGGGGLIIDIPLREPVGPGLAIPLIHGEVELVDHGVRLELSAEITLEIGPFAAAVRRMGLQAVLPFAEGDHEAHAKFAFKPPSGISLAIDSPAVKGGGVLEIDVEKGRYAGALELSAKVFTISALGLLLTKMPDGGPGWALYFSLFAEFSPVIQLGFGFGLAGVGGILAVHRRLDKEALKQVVRAGNIDAVLFPGDVAKDPGRVLSTIETLFPVARGSVVFGPALKIVWGKDDLITGSLGVYLSLPDPILIALVGRIELSILGEAEEGEEERPPLVSLRMDIGGAADLSEGTLELDARVTGKITVLELFGDMAFRARFKHKPGFLLSVGGFHPAFEPPADLQDMERMTARIGFKKGLIDVGLTFQSYLALTSNTFQFGASIDAIAKIGGFCVEGGVYFDALIIFKPFHLTASMGGHFTLTVNGEVWLGVSVDLELDGPGPWEVRGMAHLKVLSFEVDKKFSGTIGDKTRKQDRAIVDPWADLLKGELTDPGNWQQDRFSPVVRVRALTEAEAAVHWLDPATPVAFRQRRVPLAERIERVGADAVAKPTTLKIASATLNGADAVVAPLLDDFAPADWRTMTEAEKLAAPSFVRMACGATIGGDPQGLPAGVDVSLDPEPIAVGPKPTPASSPADALAKRRHVPRGLAVGPTLQPRTR